MDRESNELKQAFAEAFPLCDERDLPMHPSHIKSFLRDRIRIEIERGTLHFTSRVVKVLCEVSPPKAHVEDMARIVVKEAKQAHSLRDHLVALQDELEVCRSMLADEKELISEILPLTPEQAEKLGRCRVCLGAPKPKDGDSFIFKINNVAEYAHESCRVTLEPTDNT